MNLKKGGLRNFWARFAAPDFRWLPRILGIPIGLLMLMEFVEGLGYLGELDSRGIVLRAGFFLVFAGCVVGFFKELPAALLILGGTATGVISSDAPLGIMMIPALVGILYLCVFLAGKWKKEERRRLTKDDAL